MKRENSGKSRSMRRSRRWLKRAPTQTAEEWTREVERLAKEHGADAVGVAAMRDEWVFENAKVPRAKWIIVIGVAHDYEEIRTAPEERAAAEVSRQYGRGIRAAKGIASALRSKGWDAFAHGGPMAGDLVLIPAAIEAGLGELGKHGSLIHRELGASFRLACILTDVPLLPSQRDGLRRRRILRELPKSAATPARRSRFMRKNSWFVASAVGTSTSTNAFRISTSTWAARSASRCVRSVAPKSVRASWRSWRAELRAGVQGELKSKR